MKKFIVSILSISIFFIGLGGLVDNVGAKFKSDERALALIAQARQAVGGDANIRGVQSLSATGKATKIFDFEGASRSEQGDWELNLQFPNRLSKMMKVRIEENGTGEKLEKSDRKVFVIEKKGGDKVIVNSGDEQPKEGVFTVRRRDGDKTVQGDANIRVDKIISEDELRASIDKMQHNDLVRTTLSLFLSTPQGIDAEYLYGGEAMVDGSSCDVVEARVGGSSVKLFLDKSSHLPRMMSYMDARPMMMFFKTKKDDAAMEEGETRTFNRKLEAPPLSEFQIKFSDYRSVGGLMLPHTWTQTVGSKADETIQISAYEINPANIAEKFENLPQKIRIRTDKKQ